jgi:hypothetical protein
VAVAGQEAGLCLPNSQETLLHYPLALTALLLEADGLPHTENTDAQQSGDESSQQHI